MSAKPKILFWDIETSLMTVYTFGLYPDSIHHDNIISDWQIMCASWKFAGDKKVSSVAWDGKTDKEVCKKLHEILINVDILVHHNGDKFDLKKLSARLMYHGLPPLPPIQTVDTLKAIKRVVSFSSNRLDYLGWFLVGDCKLSTPKNLWVKATEGDPKAIKTLVKYNKQDVLLLEKVYYVVLPFIKNHPNMNLFTTDDVCPNCGSKNLTKQGFKHTRTSSRQQYRCKDCGSWSSGGKNQATVNIR